MALESSGYLEVRGHWFGIHSNLYSKDYQYEIFKVRGFRLVKN